MWPRFPYIIYKLRLRGPPTRAGPVPADTMDAISETVRRTPVSDCVENMMYACRKPPTR